MSPLPKKLLHCSWYRPIVSTQPVHNLTPVCLKSLLGWYESCHLPWWYWYCRPAACGSFGFTCWAKSIQKWCDFANHCKVLGKIKKRIFTFGGLVTCPTLILCWKPDVFSPSTKSAALITFNVISALYLWKARSSPEHLKIIVAMGSESYTGKARAQE